MCKGRDIIQRHRERGGYRDKEKENEREREREREEEKEEEREEKTFCCLSGACAKDLSMNSGS